MEGPKLHPTDGGTNARTGPSESHPGEEQPWPPLVPRHHGNACQGLDHLALSPVDGHSPRGGVQGRLLLSEDHLQFLARGLCLTATSSRGGVEGAGTHL